jgi:hypothetical protein
MELRWDAPEVAHKIKPHEIILCGADDVVKSIAGQRELNFEPLRKNEHEPLIRGGIL